jgi:hypothetical protein
VEIEEDAGYWSRLRRDGYWSPQARRDWLRLLKLVEIDEISAEKEIGYN